MNPDLVVASAPCFAGERTQRQMFWRRACVAVLAVLCMSFPAGAMSLKAVLYGALGATSYVLDDEGQLWAWGSNKGGQYGDGTTLGSLNAVRIGFPEGVSAWTQFVAGSSFAALDQKGRIYGWGQYEALVNSFSIPAQNTPFLVDQGSWQSIAVTTGRDGTTLQPWGLGATSGGELCWIRVPKPAKADAAPFSARYTEPAPGTGDATGFVEVMAGAQFFLARTESGRVFAAGVGSTGALGPKGEIKATGFNPTFVEIPPPGQGDSWTRIAATEAQAFAWNTIGDLYVWGRRFDVDAGWITDPVPRLVPAPFGGGQWKEVSGTGIVEPTTLLLTTLGQVWGAGTSGVNWVQKYANGRDLIRERSRLALPNGLTPIQTLSEGPLHLLMQAKDGRVRAIGYSDDYQLGGFPTGDFFDYQMMIPGGEAPFLLGRNADVAVLSLGQSGTDILEPTRKRGDGQQAQQYWVDRSGRLDQSFSMEFALRIRTVEGVLLSPAESASVASGLMVYSTIGGFFGGTPQYQGSLTPRFVVDQDLDYFVEVELLPNPQYEIAGPSLVTFRYRHTTPTHYPPSVRLLWPPEGQRFYTGNTVDFVFEVIDRDGYPKTTNLDLLGGGGPFQRTKNLAAVSTNTSQLVEYHVPVTNPFDWYDKDVLLRVTDNDGEITTLNVRHLALNSSKTPTLQILLGDRISTLWLNLGWGDIVLEGSSDLDRWHILRTFQEWLGKLPATPLQLTPSESTNSFFRLRSLNQ